MAKGDYIWMRFQPDDKNVQKWTSGWYMGQVEMVGTSWAAAKRLATRKAPETLDSLQTIYSRDRELHLLHFPADGARQWADLMEVSSSLCKAQQ